jgi:hypothetical protein
LEKCIRIGGDDVSWEEFNKLIIIVTAAFYVPLLHFNRTPETWFGIVRMMKSAE